MYISRVFGNRESERLLGASPFTHLSQLHLKNCLRFVLGNGEKHTHTQRNRTICFFASVPKILHTHTYIERVLGASPSPHFSQFFGICKWKEEPTRINVRQCFEGRSHTCIERLLGASPFTHLSPLLLKNCLRFVFGNGENHTHR